MQPKQPFSYATVCMFTCVTFVPPCADSAEVDVAMLAFLWHKGREPFHKGGTPIDLMFRVATVEDCKDPTAPRRTRELWKDSTGRVRRPRHMPRCCSRYCKIMATA
jgi:hypothetical protein